MSIKVSQWKISVAKKFLVTNYPIDLDLLYYQWILLVEKYK